MPFVKEISVTRGYANHLERQLLKIETQLITEIYVEGSGAA